MEGDKGTSLFTVIYRSEQRVTLIYRQRYVNRTGDDADMLEQ